MIKSLRTSLQKILHEEYFWEQTIFGACGGLCLVFIRANDLDFVLTDIYEVLGFSIAAVPLIFMATVVTIAMKEESRSKMLITGLLAPSFLFNTLVNQGDINKDPNNKAPPLR